MHTAMNIVLRKGFVSLAKAWKIEHNQSSGVSPPMMEHRTRLSPRFRPMIEMMEKRVMDTTLYKRDHGITNEDKAFLKQATAFMHMFSICQDIIRGEEPDYANCSVWVRYVGDMYYSPYIHLEICNKDGKHVQSSVTLYGLLVDPPHFARKS